MTYQFRQSEPPTPRYWGWLGLLLLAAAVIWGSTRVYGQSAGDPKWFFKGAGAVDQTGYTTKVNSTLYAINGSGAFTLLAQSNFANASHSHAFADLTGKPTTIAGYGITDFNSLGDARWDPLTHGRAQHDGTPMTSHEFGVYDMLEGRAERATGDDVLQWIRDDGDSRWSLLGHAHAASDITSGVLATARLGTGTANSSTYLRGDGSWQTLASGVTDHGALTGLADDDHTQYHTDARGDARYSLLGHVHAAGDITSGVFGHARLGTGGGGSTKFLREDGTWQTISSGGSGTVTSVSVTTANGVSGSVATATTTPAISLTLGAITPTSVNGVTLSGSATPTLAVTGTTAVSGTNTGDQDLSGYVEDGDRLSLGLTFPNSVLKLEDNDQSNWMRVALGSDLTATRTFTLTTGDADRTLTLGGDATLNGGTHSGTNTGDQTLTSLGVSAFVQTTLDDADAATFRATIGAGTGSGTVTSVSGTPPMASSGGATPAISIANADADGSTKGAASFAANDFEATAGNVSIDYANAQVASGVVNGFLKSSDFTAFAAKQSAITFGTGVQTALGVNVGSAGAPVLFNGALGTPSSGTLTNCTFPTLNQNTTGSAATLTTARTINGTSFNGSADITVTAAAGTLTGATLASGVTASSLTSAAGGSFGTAAYVNTGTGSTNVPTIAQADARYDALAVKDVTNNFTFNSASYTDLTGSSISLSASTAYQFTAMITYTCPVVGTGIGLSVTMTGSPTARSLLRQQPITTTGTVVANIDADDAGSIATGSAGTTALTASLTGTILTSGSASTVQLRVARGGTSNTITILSATIIAHPL